jgi:PHD/YefM family antitoxin component YafN of YafNO toxin-antitoxin module
MNSISIADIKRGGMDALSAALHRGPAAIMKRNRVAAVVLTPEAYERLTQAAERPGVAPNALDWLLQTAPTHASGLTADGMSKRLAGLTGCWAER